MVAILAMGMGTPARADLEIWLSEVNNPPIGVNQVANDTTTPGSSPGFTFYNNSSFDGNLHISMTAGSTSPGTTPPSQTTSATTTLINTASSGSITVYLSIGSNGFTVPTAPFTVTTSVSATVVTGSAANLLSYNSYMEMNNGQNSTTGTTTASPQTLNITAAASGLEDSQTFSVASTGGTPYGMTEIFRLTLGHGSSITLSSSTVATPSAAPEPSTMAIAGIGALGMIGYGLRRRKAMGA